MFKRKVLKPNHNVGIVQGLLTHFSQVNTYSYYHAVQECMLVFDFVTIFYDFRFNIVGIFHRLSDGNFVQLMD